MPLTFSDKSHAITCVAGLIITLDYIFNDDISILLGLDVLAPLQSMIYIYISDKQLSHGTLIVTDERVMVRLPLEMRKGLKEKNMALASIFRYVERKEGLAKAQLMIHTLRAQESLVYEIPTVHVSDPADLGESTDVVPSFPFLEEWNNSQKESLPYGEPLLAGKLLTDGRFVCPSTPLYSSTPTDVSEPPPSSL